MYEVWGVVAALEIRTHEDGDAPPCLQPLQVALLRQALPRPPHPPRTRGAEKTLPPAPPLKGAGSTTYKRLSFTSRKTIFYPPKDYLSQCQRLSFAIRGTILVIIVNDFIRKSLIAINFYGINLVIPISFCRFAARR